LADSSTRERDSQLLHDALVEQIATTRFGLKGWNVVTNPGVAKDDGHLGIRPDIVARQDSEIVATGQVETHETANLDEVNRWKSMGQLCPRFYLFVPEGTEQAVANLLSEHEVACAGLRAYSNTGNELRVRSVWFKNGHSSEDTHEWWLRLGGGEGPVD
jgi:hypothetical protein